MNTFKRIRTGIRLTAKSVVQRRWALVRLGARCVIRDIKAVAKGKLRPNRKTHVIIADPPHSNATVKLSPKDEEERLYYDKGTRLFYEVVARSNFNNQQYVSHNQTERVTTFNATIAKLEFKRLSNMHMDVEHRTFLVSNADHDNPQLIKTVMGDTS